MHCFQIQHSESAQLSSSVPQFDEDRSFMKTRQHDGVQNKHFPSKLECTATDSENMTVVIFYSFTATEY
jgi:hypothetical protein